MEAASIKSSGIGAALAPIALIGLVGLAGCMGKIGSHGATGSGSGSGSGVTTGSGGVTGTGGTGSVDVAACATGVHATRMPLKRLTPNQYANAVRDLFNGKIQPSTRFPPQSAPSVTGFSTEPDSNAVDQFAAEQILFAAEDAALQVPAALAQLLPCASSGGASCADTFIRTFGKRAYRRPLEADEVTNLTKQFSDAQTAGFSFAEAIAVVADVLLQSPQFLYLPEIGVGTDEVRPLTQHELATRLAFLLWDSPPDDALLTAADNGALGTVEQIEAEARRLLAGDRANVGLQRFFREWTKVQTLTAAGKDQKTFPQFTSAVASSIDESFNRFVLSAARNGTLTDLLTSNRAFVNPALASFLGVTPPAGGNDQWSEVTMDSARYAGIATQPALLANLAHFADTSYVFRGVFVLRGMMCMQLGEPPADAQTVASGLPLPANPSARQRSEAIRQNGTCGSCHGLIDPLGLAFEHFDGVGRWRDVDQFGNAIQTAGSLPGTSGFTFASPTEVMSVLASGKDFQNCFGTQWYRFFAGRPETTEDQCAIAGLGEAADTSSGSISEMLLALTKSAAFTHRRFTEGP